MVGTKSKGVIEGRFWDHQNFERKTKVVDPRVLLFFVGQYCCFGGRDDFPSKHHPTQKFNYPPKSRKAAWEK